MKPQWTEYQHNPPHSYGDCLRACIASLLEVPRALVPHFNIDGAHGPELWQRINSWLHNEHSLLMFGVGWTGDIELDTIVEVVSNNNPGIHFMVIGALSDGTPHCCIYRDGEMVHDPATWQTGGLVKALDDIWSVIVLVPAVLHHGA